MENCTLPMWKSIKNGCFLTFKLAFLLFCLALETNAQTRTYTSSGSFQVPAGVTSVQVQAWGGGGAGGGVNGSNSQTRAGGGGAGGSFTQNNAVTVTPGANIIVTVGAGGEGAESADGGAGGTSTFASTPPVTAAGGAGGIEGDGSPQYGGGASATTGITRNGGAGSAASGGNSGAGGGGAGSTGNGGNASGTTAGSGGSGGGGAGGAGRNSNGDGNNAVGLAGGGGGGRSTSNTDRAGGDGFRGQVNVTWTCPTYALNANPTAPNMCSSAGTSNTITLSGTPSGLPVGIYTVTYTRSSPSATGLTATMTVTTAGTGTFEATGISNTGNCTITVTGLSSGNGTPFCSVSLSSNNAVTFSRAAAATVAAGNSITTCGGSTINITSGATATNFSSLLWTSSGSGTFTNSTSLSLCEYTPSSADLANGMVTITLTAIGNGSCNSVNSSKVVSFVQSPNTTGISFCQGASGNLTSAVINSGLLTLAGTWGTSLNAIRPDTGSSNTCDFTYSGGAQTRNYHAIKFRVSVTGSYTFTMTQNNAYDGMGYVYSGNFVPGSCGSGTHIRRDDDSGPDDEPLLTMTLSAGTVYTLISTTYGNTGTYIGSFSWNVTPPSGGLIVPVTEWYTTATGGNPIAFGDTFNPIGTPGSGLTNTNTPGITLFHAANSLSELCPRVATPFEILLNQNYYTDNDGDGFGGTPVVSCTGQPIGTVTNNLDSNDSLITYSDNDGDGFGSSTMAPSGVTNSLDCNDNQLQYADTDGDGFGSNELVACGVSNNTDCDPLDALKNSSFSFYLDADTDGYGSGAQIVGICAINATTPPLGYAMTNDDCDDSDGTVYRTDSFFADADGDNYATNLQTTTLCYGLAEPNGYSLINLGVDCDDNVAAVNPGMVEILYDGYDNNCDGQLDEGNQIVVNMSGCGTTLAAISSLISCVSTPGIDGYRFEITNMATSHVQTIDRPLQFFSMTQLSQYHYATTYSIRVMARRNGIWLNYYGSPCQFSTPPVTSPLGGTGSLQLQTYCGQTLPSINTIIATTSLPGATGYRFRVTNDLTGEVQTIDRSLHWFSMTMLNSFHYGTTYTVDVAVKTTSANFPVNPQFGAACTISTPALPSLTMHCDQTIPTKGVLIPTQSLNRATLYRFEVTRYTDNTASTVQDISIVDKNLHRFSLNDITNYSPNTTYGVRVTIMTSGSFPQSSIPGQLVWGDACLITSPSALRTSVEESSVREDWKINGSPNPFDSEFSLSITSFNGDTVHIEVFDSIGKHIESRQIHDELLPTIALGQNYPRGLYLVTVTHGENRQTLKMIKQ